jgi:Flp pilus assembly protein TadD
MPHPRWKILACLFLVLATLVVYAEIRNHQFVDLDDDNYVVENPPVKGGLTLAGFVWAFTTLHAGFWIPLTWLSFMWDGQLFGVHAGGFLLTNLLFHIANALLLFLWLHRTTRALGRSFLVAALFALHPLHVESVAWVTERKDVLSTFFWLLTMWAYLWYAAGPGIRRYLMVLVCFSLGLMAKPMLVTLPFVLLLLDFWPLGRLSFNGPAMEEASLKPNPGVPIRRLVWEKVPLFALSALCSVVTFCALKLMGAPLILQDLSLTSRLSNALVAYVSYLAKMVWPSGLAVYYPHPGNAISLWQVLEAGLLLASLSLLVIWQSLRRPYLLVGWLWYLGTLVPIIGLVQAGAQSMADRFTYVPLIGLFLIVAWGTVDLTVKCRAARFLLPVGAGVVLSGLMICTWLQVRHWGDSISLFEHALRVTENNAFIHNNLGNALFRQGQVEQAMAHYAEALRLRPNDAVAHIKLGLALLSQGQVEQAMAHYAEALRLQPDFDEAHIYLGNALFRQGQVEKAMAHYAEVLRLYPRSAVAHINLGLALLSQGQVEQAMAHYAEALRLYPNYAEAYNGLGGALMNQGRIDEALIMFQKAVQIKPNFSEAYYNLGFLFAKQGDVNKAIAMFQKAVQINPNNTGAQKMLSTLEALKPRD